MGVRSTEQSIGIIVGDFDPKIILEKRGIRFMKELMLGNKAVARGLYEAGCKVISSYPGTPSTEITEEQAAAYKESIL